MTGIVGISYDLLSITIAVDWGSPIRTTIVARNIRIKTLEPRTHCERKGFSVIGKFNILEKECSLNTPCVKNVEQSLREAIAAISSRPGI